jgi:hypothetical protein
MNARKTPEELRRLMELRRSNAATPVKSKKTYSRKNKCQSLMLELKKERGSHHE